jgi:hypothetical protein
MVKKKKKRYLNGTWFTFTREEAQQGIVLTTIKQYLQKQEEGHKFYGITVHDRSDGFRYFIGHRDEKNYNLEIEAHLFYEMLLVLDPYHCYEEFLKTKHQVKTLLGGDLRFHKIPNKIEKYQYIHDEIKLMKIQIPITK